MRVFGCGLWLPPANSCWGLWWVCLGSDFAFSPPILAWVLGCVCLCARSACTPPFLADVCGVCIGVRLLLSPRQSWLGYWGLSVPVRVRLWASPRYSLLGRWGVCVFVRAPPVPRHSWRGCVVRVSGCGLQLHPSFPGRALCGVCLAWDFFLTPPILAGMLGCLCWCACTTCTPSILAALCGVCVSGFGLWFHPGNRGWGVGVCVCFCACSACSPPVFGWVYGVCVWVPDLLSPRRSWLGSGVCVWVFGYGFWLHPAIHGGRVGVCVCFGALRLYPANSGWRPRCVCSAVGFGFGPPFLARACGVCAGVWVLLSPVNRRLGVGVCVLVSALHLNPAIPGWSSSFVCLG